MIKIIKAEEEHYTFIQRVARAGRLRKWPRWIYKMFLVLALGYGMIVLYKDKPAGFLFAVPVLGAVFVHQIGVLPKFRSKGLGGQMLESVHKENDSVYLIPKPAVRGWYEKKGYKRLLWGPLYYRSKSC